MIVFLLFLILISNAEAVTTPFVVDVDSTAESILHPDCHYFKNGFDGYKYWMFATPYPGNAQERPWGFRSNDGDTWVQTGFANPVWDPVTSLGWTFYADPDWLAIDDYQKCFMIGGPCMSGTSPNTECALDFITANYPCITWASYAGAANNGNTNPVILAGDATGTFSSDSAAVAWESRTSDGISKLQYPTMIFKNGVFHIWYGETSGNGDNTTCDGGLTNNVGKIGYATATWNPATGAFAITRYAGNPIIDLAKDATYYCGMGHIEVSIMPNGEYEMIGLRVKISPEVSELVRLTAHQPQGPWTYEGTLQAAGAGGTWNDTGIYRSSVCTDGKGRQVMLNGRRQIILTGLPTANEFHLGWYDDTNFGNTFREAINNAVLKGFSQN